MPAINFLKGRFHTRLNPLVWPDSSSIATLFAEECWERQLLAKLTSVPRDYMGGPPYHLTIRLKL